MNTLALQKIAVDAAVDRASAPLVGQLRDLVGRLEKIENTPLPLWAQNQALAAERASLEKSVGAPPAMTDAALLAQLLTDPAVAARARHLDPRRLT